MSKNQGPLTEFGKLFLKHYGITKKDNSNLYSAEIQYCKRHGHVRWDENIKVNFQKQESEFGKLFFQRYGITKKDNSNLYAREITYYNRHGYTSWDENGNQRPKLQSTEEYRKRQSQSTKERWANGTFLGNTGMKLKYKPRNKKEQKTMTIKDYANQLKTKFDSVSANWNKLTIEQLEQIENCLNLVVKPVVAPQPAPVKKRKRKFNGFSEKVKQQKAEYQYDVSNGYTGKYREWLKLKKAGGTIYTNKIQ